LLVSCAVPAEPTLSVHRSVLLGEYANPPLWVWSGIGPVVAAVEVSVDGEPYRRLDPSAKSYRPPRPLAPGRHTLSLRVRTAGVAGFDAKVSAEARVAALPGRPPVPDDPCYPAAADAVHCGGSDDGQWPLRQIRLPEVWHALAAGVLRAPAPVVVAVLDTGYVPHPDLLRNLDADAGYDFIRDPGAAHDGDGLDPDATDPATDGLWHGTAVAGIIAAQTGNGTGVAGMGWPWDSSRVTIMPVRVVAQRGATSYDVAQGLLYAAGLANDSGIRPPRPARIINLSLADSLPGPPDEVLEDALRRVTAAGAIVVSAAGNHGSAVRAPANSGYTLAVGSVGMHGSLAATSNRGPEIDVVAPGGDQRGEIRTLGVDRHLGPPHWIVTLEQGTSMAAAHVSGVLALLAGVSPALTLNDARAILAASAADLGAPGRDDRFGHGLLDAFALFGAYPGVGSAPLDRLLHERAGDMGAVSAGAAAPGSVDPHSLIVRFRDGGAAGGHALVRLDESQDREELKARLRTDPAVAAVYDNRIYLPAGGPAQ
jgi:subtilisin family serine protease